MTARKDVPSGTLDMLVLRVISRGPIHGWGLMKRLGELTDNVFQVTPGGYGPGQPMLTTIDLPVISHVTRASSREPFLGMMLTLDARSVLQIASEMDEPRPRRESALNGYSAS